jgi:ADP-ribose pyrophosphatase YjhB (NUDIX family)
VETTIALDMAGVHLVRVRREGQEVVLALEHTRGDRRSAAHDALAECLRIRCGGRELRFEHATARAPARDAAIVATFDDAPPLVMATLDETRYRLSPFEVRYASDNGRLHPVPLAAREAERARPPVTDLHTHFAGCVLAEDLVALGAAQGVAYPAALLEEAGIRATGPGDVRLAELGPELRAKLASRLEVPIDRRITFREMEQIYRLRAPITKARAMLVPLLGRIAHDYRAMGVRRVELSLSNVVEADVLRIIHREVPRIEDESGVAIRFLAAIGRHDDPEWDLDLVQRIRELAGSVYLTGVDFMGHETNSTRAFAPTIRAIAEWAHRARPGFVVRVHAGESPSHPENVRVAVEATSGCDVEMRVGHGLFGVDDETLERIVRQRAIVEFNLDSNVALNHLLSARAVPLRRYVEAGADVVLGTDGYGIYRTSMHASMRAALLAGLEARHLEGPLAAAERRYLERARTREAPMDRSFDVPGDPAPVHYTPLVAARRRERIRERDAALAERLAAIGASQVDAAEVAALRGGRQLISFAGAWTRSWEAMPEGARALVTRELEALIDALDPREAVLVTGGTRFGVEGIVARRARARGFDVLGAIVRETPPSSLEAGLFTHGHVAGETLYDKVAGLYELVSDNDGACVFVSGGQIVGDEIQTAANGRLRYLLMDGVGGASERHAREQPARAFRTAEEAVHALRAMRATPRGCAPHWFRGPNPTVDAVVVRAGRELLLVRRDMDAPAEPGKWSLPGGFVATGARRGSTWAADRETDEEACARELREETGLAIAPPALVRIGVYEGGGRDPRDGDASWSRSTAFLVHVPDGPAMVAGGDDAADARWFPLDALPRELAFDHARIVADALALSAVIAPS